MNNKESLFKKTINGIVVLFFGLITLFSGCNTNREGKMIDDKSEVLKYTDNLLEFSIDNYAEEAVMTLRKTRREEIAMIKIVLNEGMVDSIEKELQNHFGSGIEIDSSEISNYQDHSFAKELKAMTQRRYFVIFEQGKKVKSRDINIYLAEDGEKYYLFIFG